MLRPTPEEMFQDCRNQLCMREMVKGLFTTQPAVELVHEDVIEGRSLPQINALLSLTLPEITLIDRKADYQNDIVVTVAEEAQLLTAYERRRHEFEPL